LQFNRRRLNGQKIEYLDIPDNKVDEFKALLSKTHGNSKRVKAHAKRTEIKSMDAFV
jgi:4-hydroxy-3-methylbut-2-enyl diphosphate reductase IspH